LFLCSIVLAVAATVAVAGEPIQSFKFEEQFSIRKALAMLGSAYQKNIVPTPAVDGSLAFRGLSGVTFEEAMDAILGEKFKYEQVGKLVKVYTKQEYKTLKEDPDRMVFDILTLYYITAADAHNLLTPVLSANAKIQVTTPAEQEISGTGGGASGALTAAAEGGGGDSMALHDTIVLYDYPENIQAAKDLLAIIDARPKQVLVEAMILAARLTEDMQLGVDWNFAAGGHLAAGAGGDAIQQIDGLPGSPFETFGFAAQGGPGLRIGASSGDFRMLITALEQVTDATILANPKVMTVNKQEGSVLIGTNLGYRSSTTISTGGVATEGQVEFLQTGTQLVFRPYIGNDGYIRMDIYPKDSSGDLNADGVPTEQTVQMKSNIIVKDGGTVVIGGLFRDTIISASSQVPLLGDLPIVGALFKGTTDRNQREEVIIFLTTHIIDEPDEAAGLEAAEDTRLKEHGAKMQLKIIGRTRLAEDAYAKGAQFYIEGDLESALVEVDYALRIRPTYLEALRLKEKLAVEMAPTEEEESAGMIIESSDAL
jgi:type IV pilus assembly protein PilQ